MRVLRELEADDLLSRTEHGTRPAPVEYALTTRALSLAPILAQLATWGRTNAVKVEQSLFHRD
jgi:DNA-binding HxlR family transcriptional regulator